MEALPVEIIVHILSFLLPEDIPRFARVNLLFAGIGTDEGLWREIFCRRYPFWQGDSSGSGEPSSWREQYVNQTRNLVRVPVTQKGIAISVLWLKTECYNYDQMVAMLSPGLKMFVLYPCQKYCEITPETPAAIIADLTIETNVVSEYRLLLRLPDGSDHGLWVECEETWGQVRRRILELYPSAKTLKIERRHCPRYRAPIFLRLDSKYNHDRWFGNLIGAEDFRNKDQGYCIKAFLR